ncbi:MAG: response regulator [Candidatus Bathyarchaeota archaeon]|nr:MAG: response regulator [Candidatus Bathyarchaeota archaeon]
MSEKANILVVDDDPSIRKTLTAILEEKGYDVETVETGKEAIRKSKTSFYNLALIDIRLPDMEGVNLLTKMTETKPRMAKIIITGYPSLQNAVEALNKGADAYIIKPFDIDKMLATVEDHLDRQHKARKMNQDQVTGYIKTRVRQLEREKR